MGGLLWALFIGLGGLPYSQLIQILGSGTRTALWLAFAQAAAAVIQTVTGSAPLTLPNAVHRAIQSLTQYGLCTQSTTPTPSAPVDIMCNNGAMRLSPNLLSGMESKTLNGVTVGIDADGVITMSGTCTASANATVLADLPLVAGDYTLKVFDKQPQSSGTRIQAYNSAAGFNLTFSMDNDTTEVTGALTTDGGVTIRVRVDGGVTYDNYKIKPMLVKGSTAPSAFVAAGAVYADGTPETLTVSATGAETQTVTDVPTLLSVGDYEDEAEIISGGMTHRIGYHVFDGTETFSKSSAYGQAFLINAASASWGADRTASVLCTHFLGLPQVKSSQDDNTCFFNQTGHFYFRVTDNSDANAFKTWLAEQYASGTPVIVFFVLAEGTTEQGTPHALHTTEGTNIIDVTSNVSPTQLSVEYAASE